MLSLSVYMFRETGLNFAAASVFATQWVAALFSAPLGGWLTARYNCAKLAAACEVAGGCASVAIGASLGVMPALFALLFVRGLAESVDKSARVVALRDHISHALIERAASLIGTATFLGISIGSLTGAVLISYLEIWQIALIDAATFLLAAGLYKSLRDPQPRAREAQAPRLGGVVQAGFAALRAHPELSLIHI